MNIRKRKSLRKYFGFIILLLKLNFISCSFNLSVFSRNESNLHDKYDLQTLSAKISEKLKQATYNELGVTSMQKMYDSFQFTIVVHDVNKDLEKMTKKLDDKLTKTFDALNNIKIDIENYCLSNIRLPISSQLYFFPTNDLQKNTNDNNVSYNKSIEMDEYDDIYLFQKRLSNITHLGITQAYFLSSFDLKSKTYSKPMYNNFDDMYIWNLYLSLTKITPRNIIIALNMGSTSNNKIHNTVKAIAKKILQMSDDTDQIGIIAFGYEWVSPYITGYNCQISSQTSPLTTDECKLYHATAQNKIIFHRFIDSMSRFNGSINHQIVFKQLFKTVQFNFESNSNETVMLLYITPTSISSYNETANILTDLSEYFKNVDIPVIINTIYVKDELKITSYKENFLRDISELNFKKYNIDFDRTENQILGKMHSVNSTSDWGLIIARLFSSLHHNKILNIKPGITLPIWQESTKDLIISVYMPCGKNTDLGLLGIDIHYSSIAEDITYYSSQLKYSYAFLLSINGLVIMHPSFLRPIVANEQPKFVDVSYFEKYDNFTLIRNLILTREKGSQQIIANNETLKFIWRRVLNWYIICIVVKESDAIPQRNKKIILTDTSTHYNLLHHRLDLLSPSSLCRHLNQISTLDAGTLYLSASCFQSPYSYLRGAAGKSVSSLTLQSYMAYIKDNTRLLANPGLKEGVRNDVTILSYMLKYLMRQHLHGSLYKYSVRRYVATINGVMQMYPGAILDVELEPTKRNWFVRAMEYPGKIVLTSPYLDAGGAGYIVTISHTIFEKSSNDNVVAVMAMDVTFGYIYKMLLETVPYCSKQETVKCFIIDDRGYLIYHPNLIDVNGKGPIEQQHIIHKESLVANDLLNHKEFVKKILCNNYADGTIQRYYKFNTSINSVLSNFVNGEHCVKYYISVIPGTNAFIGVVNFTCTDVATFCPCSTVNRLCLICNRVEQNECECPCECLLNLENETCSQTNKKLTDNQLCSAVTETSPFTSNSMYYNIAADLKPCLPFLCEIHTTYESCIGLLGCEWCHLDMDGETKLQNPFCTSLTMCFHGILGSVSPYRDVHLEAISSDDLFVSTYSSVGPAAGSIVALCFILALVFYCYRQYSLQFIERLYPNSTPSRTQRVQMSSINVDNFNDESTSHQDKLLANFPKDIGPISPYCITTEYRKPATGVDSDLGYSTMTPHEESERLSFALIELDSFEDDCNTSDAVSTNTSVLAFKSPRLVPKNSTTSEIENKMVPEIKESHMTTLPNKHFILAPVTVHRNMETI